MNHEEALDAICGVQGVTVLSYQEAVEGYLKLRGIPLASAPPPAADEARTVARRLNIWADSMERAKFAMSANEHWRDTCALLREAAALLSRVPSEEATEEVYKHKKRGTVYTVIGEAELQTASRIEEGDELIVYRGEDGRLWARPYREFHDGRFERITRAPGAVV